MPAIPSTASPPTIAGIAPIPRFAGGTCVVPVVGIAPAAPVNVVEGRPLADPRDPPAAVGSPSPPPKFVDQSARGRGLPSPPAEPPGRLPGELPSSAASL